MNNVYTLLLAPRPAGEARGGGPLEEAPRGGVRLEQRREILRERGILRTERVEQLAPALGVYPHGLVEKLGEVPQRRISR